VLCWLDLLDQLESKEMRRKWRHDDQQSPPISEIELARYSQLWVEWSPMRTGVRTQRMRVEAEDGNEDRSDLFGLG
jgi:hypothetical protein